MDYSLQQAKARREREETAGSSCPEDESAGRQVRKQPVQRWLWPRAGACLETDQWKSRWLGWVSVQSPVDKHQVQRIHEGTQKHECIFKIRASFMRAPDAIATGSWLAKLRKFRLQYLEIFGILSVEGLKWQRCNELENGETRRHVHLQTRKQH